MSIFRDKTDRGIPLLSQLYQLDTTNDAEVAEFIGLQFPDVSAWLHSADASPESREFQLRTFRQASLLTKDVMTQLHDLGGLSRSVLGSLNSYLEIYPVQINLVNEGPVSDDYPSPMELAMHGATSEMQSRAEAIIPIGELSSRIGNDIVSHIVTVLYSLIVDIKENRVFLSRCPECENVFIKRRADSVFCSARCVNASGQRRRRNSKRISQKEVV